MEDKDKQRLDEIKSKMDKLIKEQKYEEVANLKNQKIQILKENGLYEEPDPNKPDEFLNWLKEVNKKGREALESLKKDGFRK